MKYELSANLNLLRGYKISRIEDEESKEGYRILIIKIANSEGMKNIKILSEFSQCANGGYICLNCYIDNELYWNEKDGFSLNKSL